MDRKPKLRSRFKKFVKHPTPDGIESIITDALRVVDGFNRLSTAVTIGGSGGGGVTKRNYDWLKLQMKVWKSTAMNRRSDIVYNFKQIATHLDYVRKVALREEIMYSSSDCQMYTEILTEYAELFGRVFLEGSAQRDLALTRSVARSDFRPSCD